MKPTRQFIAFLVMMTIGIPALDDIERTAPVYLLMGRHDKLL